MSENYKFVQHLKCEYFPCHKIAQKEDFNCLFCYCPLYALKDQCGGNFKYTNNIKDCSHCTIVHGKSSYEHVMSRISRVIKLGSERD